MKKTKLFGLFSLFAGAMMALAVMGCSNVIEDLRPKDDPTPIPDPEPEPEPSTVTYNIGWLKTVEELSKSPYDLATTATTIVFGLDKDYASVIADTENYKKYAVGETDTDAVYAYYKEATGTPDDSELYFLSKEEIVFAENDMPVVESTPVGPFYACSQAESIVLKNINTKALTSMFGMFLLCDKLETLDLSGLDTENVTDMSLMFALCGELEQIDVSMLNTSKVENMYSMFQMQDATKLKKVIFGDFDTSNVTNMENLFSGCEELTDPGVSNFNTSKVTNMKQMFRFCVSLKTLDLSNFDTANVETMRFMFNYCEQLESINLSGWNTEKVTTMDHMFEECRALKSLDLSSFKTSSLENMEHMFTQCYALKSLDVSNFDTSNVTNMCGTFSLFSSMTELDISSFKFDSLTSANNMFGWPNSTEHTSTLRTIYVSEGTDLSSKSELTADDMFAYCDYLVGGKGTAYSLAISGKESARIDGGTTSKGLFTKKGDAPYPPPAIPGSVSLSYAGGKLTANLTETIADAVYTFSVNRTVVQTGNTNYITGANPENYNEVTVTSPSYTGSLYAWYCYD